MEEFYACLDRLVAEGVKAYIELLCSGERERSKRLLKDIMQVSSLAAGGPSSKTKDVPWDSTSPSSRSKTSLGGRSMTWALIYYTTRSILASLLVLRATAYWTKVPRLESLQTCCRVVADYVVETRRGGTGQLACSQCKSSGHDDRDGTACGHPAPDADEPISPRLLAVAETH